MKKKLLWPNMQINAGNTNVSSHFIGKVGVIKCVLTFVFGKCTLRSGVLTILHIESNVNMI